MAIAHFLIADAAVVACDAVLTACHVGALMLRNRRGGVERDRIPNHLCSTLPHVMREGEGAACVRSDDLEATIRSATASKAEIVQKHRDGNQLGIRIERTTLCQLCAKEPRARHVVEKPGRRFRPLPARRLPGRHDYRAGSNPMLGRLPAHRRNQAFRYGSYLVSMGATAFDPTEDQKDRAVAHA